MRMGGQEKERNAAKRVRSSPVEGTVPYLPCFFFARSFAVESERREREIVESESTKKSENSIAICLLSNER